MDRLFFRRGLVIAFLFLLVGGAAAYRGWLLTRIACISESQAARVAEDVKAERELAYSDPFAERLADADILPPRQMRADALSEAATRAAAEAGFYLTLPYPQCAAPAFPAELTAHEQTQSRIRALKGSKAAVAIEHGWKADTAIYCRSLVALHRLVTVQETQAEACKSHPSKYTQGCRTKSAAAHGLAEEIEQLTVVRGINEKKLRDKWGSRLAELSHCDLGDPISDRHDRDRSR